MIKNFLKIALRGFWKHKVFTLINITGLSIGISASIVIFLISYYDFSFDKFHKDSDRIYRVVSDFTYQGEEGHNRGVSGPVASAIQRQCTGVEFTAPVYIIGPDVFIESKKGAPTKYKGQERIAFTGPQYFRIFNYQWLAGSAASALNEPNQVVLTSDQAKLYFPSLAYNQMIGKLVTYDTLKTTVTGIVEAFTENTDFTIHDFISFSTVTGHADLIDMVGLNEWGNTSSSSVLFIKLSPKIAAANIEKQLNDILKKASPPDPADKGRSTRALSLQKLSDIHFDSKYGTFDFSDSANKNTLYGLLAIAGFLLLLASINFINLTTAQATQRAKEIGIRKTMGSSRSQLVFQFLSETFIITLLAVIISVALTPVILKIFADFIAPGVKADFINHPNLIFFLIALTFLVSMLSGFYPAILLSGYKPVQVLKNQAQNNSSKTRTAWLRKSLTVSQFVIAQFFIIATIMVSKQIYFALHKDLGFKKDAIVVIRSPYQVRKETTNRLLLNKLKAMPQVETASIGYEAPSSGNTNTTTARFMKGKNEIETAVELKYGDENYLNLYHIKILAGRNITAADSSGGFVINNAYAKILGFNRPEEALGKQVYKFNGENKMTIVGVIGDFAERSVRSAINPLAFLYANRNYETGTLSVALKPETAGGKQWKTALAAMGKAWKEAYPEDDFNYQFFDESIAKFYSNEQHTSTLLTWAMGLSILISCLGLLGLAIYTTNQRTKEIGVRKVLGASVAQIVTLLSKELVLLIILAFVIVTPLAWWAVSKWIENYADRTTISWWIFAASGTLMLVAAVCTSCFQTIRAAIVNPVESLRGE